MSKLALELIEKEKQERTGKLDLGNCGLKKLPEELFELVWLEELNLASIYYTFNGKKYTKNRVANSHNGATNEIFTIPSDIEQLGQLQNLYINNYTNNENPQGIIDISYFAKLTNLRVLDLGVNRITDIRALSNLTKLQLLYLGENSIIDIRPISNLTNLQSLNLGSNQIKNVVPLSQLINLKSLNLGRNNITKVNSLSKLTKLRRLNLSNNQIKSVNLLAKIKKLKKLFLTNNQINDITPLSNLLYLEELELDENQIDDIQPLVQLERLNILSLNQNLIKDVPSLSKMFSLKSLSLRENLIEKIFLKNFLYLKDLDLSKNQITTFYLAELYSLNNLDLSENNISDILSLLPLIKESDIQNVSYEYRPPSLSFTPGVFLYKNPIKKPPLEIVRQGNQAIINYFKELEKGEQPNHRIKMIIIGNGRVGKTSLLKRLKNEPYNAYENYTHGIQIGQLQKENLPESKTAELALNVWDFGGQEIFYATHQFFLSEEALYVLAWTDEANVKTYRERDKATLPFDEKWRSNEYWLESIRLRSKTSPILMVQTHIDCKKVAINEGLFIKAPYKATCLNFSAAKDYGLPILKDTITQKINNELPLYGKPFPITYNRVIEEIERLKNEENKSYISYDYFVNRICYDANINQGGEATLCSYLNNTGVVVHYPKNDKLKDKVYINPNWLTNQVYTLINNQLRDLNGRIDKQYLEENLPTYQETGLVELLKAFELIFETGEVGETIYIAPQYLSKTYNSKELRIQKRRSVLAFVFRFPKFMPDNVMVNFISRYGSFAEDVYWKNGIYFGKYDTACIVEQKGNSLFVYTDKGKNTNKLQREICNAFVELSHYANAYISLDNEVFIDYAYLKKCYFDKYRDITSVCGKKLGIQDYLCFFENSTTLTKMKSEKEMDIVKISDT